MQSRDFMTTVMKSWRCTVQKNFLHHPVNGTFYELLLLFWNFHFFLRNIFCWKHMQSFAYSSLIINFKGILVKLKNIAHAISVE